MLPLLWNLLFLPDRHVLQGLDDLLSLLLLLLPRRCTAGGGKLRGNHHWGPREEGQQGLRACRPYREDALPEPGHSPSAGRTLYLLGPHLPAPPHACHHHCP